MTTDSAFNSVPDAKAVVDRAYEASVVLAKTKGDDRARALEAMADALREASDDILEANTLDLEASREMAVPELILEWLKLTPERIGSTIAILEKLAQLPDPLRQVMNATYQVGRSQSYSQLMPLGTIALVYEAFPDFGAIAAGLCVKTGNTLILRGGTEASHSNAAIAQALQRGIEQSNLPLGTIELFPPDVGVSTRDLIRQDKYINLVIPYGRPSLVQQVVRQATAPVLKSAMGNCYLYWSPTGSMDLARATIVDSHASEPDPVNAIEKVLVNAKAKPSSLSLLWNSLKEKGFTLKGDRELADRFPELEAVEDDAEWNRAYLTKTVAFKTVEDLDAAIAWIDQHSSGHADCIVTESYQESCQFAVGIHSASIYINTSPRFHRAPPQGDAVFLGMSNQKGHRRGSIGLETLTTTKHVIQGWGEF